MGCQAVDLGRAGEGLAVDRGAMQVGEEDADLTARLRSLGYVEESADAVGWERDAFVLPPPGESILAVP